MRTGEQGHSGLAAIVRLQRIVIALANGETPDRVHASWLAECFSRYFTEATSGLDMDAPLGLVPSSGVVSWWRARQQAERDRLLRSASRWRSTRPGKTPNGAEVALVLRHVVRAIRAR